jgi:hypothetical protein
VDLDGFVGDPGGHFAGEEFGDGGDPCLGGRRARNDGRRREVPPLRADKRHRRSGRDDRSGGREVPCGRGGNGCDPRGMITGEEQRSDV